MSRPVFMCVLLCVLIGGAACVCVPDNSTLWIEKDGCSQCVAINTTICSGFCFTQDTNISGRMGKNYLIQRGCMPSSIVYRNVHVPGCPEDVSPLLSYPEARRCRCGRCHRNTHHCVRTGRASPYRCPAKPHRTTAQASREKPAET